MSKPLNITARTKFLGVMGYPVAHSLSPAMQNAAFAHYGLDWIYLALSVLPKDLIEALKGIKALGIIGANVTIPHKEAVVSLVDDLTPEARLIGAVNVLGIKDGRLIGHNTDGIGFLQSLQQDGGFVVKGSKVLILGAGGAARAIAITLAGAGAQQIGIANRTWQRAKDLAILVIEKTGVEAIGLSLEIDELATWMAEADLIVQTSPVGMHPKQEILPDWYNPQYLSSKCLVCDLIYSPRPTSFLKMAASKGCRTLDGLGMLLYQGAHSFTWWTGLEAPLEEMYRSLLDALALVVTTSGD
jgi:shikimate dehydrogenase